jgi:hypothetical protein
MEPAMRCLSVLSLVILSLNSSAKDLDFGDHRSETLTIKAWKAFGANEYADAIAYADKCIELHQAAALKMQAELKAYASDTEASEYWALNDVGTCYFIKAKALVASGKESEAKKAYQYLADKLKFSQCWDPQGWYWFPAEAAQEALDELK